MGANLYASTYNENGGEIWRSANGSSWGQVSSDGFGVGGRSYITSLEVYGSSLYAATFNSASGGATIWRCLVCDGSDWVQVVSGGFGDSSIGGMSGLRAANNSLIFVVGASSAARIGTTVWRSSDGLTWDQVGFDGFGDHRNLAPYWGNSVTTYQGNLVVGTWNGDNGGEVWQLLSKLYLPLITR